LYRIPTTCADRARLTFLLCDNQTIVLNLRSLALLFVTSITALGCHAQTPSPVTLGQPLPPATARRVEVLLRQKANLPPGSTVVVGPATSSQVNGFKDIAVTVVNEGKASKPINFLISDDGKTMAQFNKFDISADPRLAVSPEGRPFRGGPATAPVVIVGFDDLECPYCARLHKTIFPAITERYGDKVHIVYKDFPLDQHPWAMHAAIDVNCLADQSGPAYWSLVDAIHAGSGEIGDDPKDPKQQKTLDRATQQLDEMTRKEGTAAHVDMAALNSCLTKQDTKAIEASKQLGTSLGIDSTPTLFINGDKIDGAVPIEFIFNVIDDALRAENIQPPPPYAPPAAAPAPAATATKPGK
jgi:protein-disulfide isomerase